MDIWLKTKTRMSMIFTRSDIHIEWIQYEINIKLTRTNRASLNLEIYWKQNMLLQSLIEKKNCIFHLYYVHLFYFNKAEELEVAKNKVSYYKYDWKSINWRRKLAFWTSQLRLLHWINNRNMIEWIYVFFSSWNK